MIYLFLSVVVIMASLTWSLYHFLKHKEKDYHNTNLDVLVKRMDSWDSEIKTMRTTAAEVNNQISTVKSMLTMSKKTLQG